MHLTKDNLRQLVRLQEQDRILDALQNSINQVPVDIEALRSTLENAKSRVAEAKNKTTKLQLSKKEKELSLGQKEEAIRKHGTELNSVKTNEAYKALQSEIDKAKADVGNLETDILTLMEDLDQSAKEEKAAAAALKDEEGKIQRDIQALEAKKAELATKAEAEKAKSANLASGVPAQAMKIYDYLRKRKQGVAMAVVKGNMCGGCRITIMPQSLIEITRGTKLISCEACQRILYNADLMAEAGAAASPSQPASNPNAGPS